MKYQTTHKIHSSSDLIVYSLTVGPHKCPKNPWTPQRLKTRMCVFPGSSDSSMSSSSELDSFGLDVQASVRFSVWVSFCEIYNDNIHDLLEQVTCVFVWID